MKKYKIIECIESVLMDHVLYVGNKIPSEEIDNKKLKCVFLGSGSELANDIESRIDGLEKKKIELALTEEIGLIVKAKTGFTYANQTDGVCCNHPEQEGVYVPLTNTRHPYVKLNEAFREELIEKADLKIAKKFDAKFKELDLPFMVDLKMINECEEAWIHVIITEEANESKHEYRPFYGLAGEEAILIYPNSD